MPKLTLWPSGEVLEVNSEENLFTQLKKAGKTIKSSCGGCASCSDCVIVVKSGEDALNPSGFEELRLLGNVFHITKERLSCQLKISGDVTIDISAHEKKSKKQIQAPEKKPQVVVRKKADLEKVEPKTFEKKEDPWFKHWEKDAPDASKAKHLGGNKRPKPFRPPSESEE
jgi:ferredoxin, 2Fe-2S